MEQQLWSLLGSSYWQGKGLRRILDFRKSLVLQYTPNLKLCRQNFLYLKDKQYIQWLQKFFQFLFHVC
jgi:hypothetical protein